MLSVFMKTNVIGKLFSTSVLAHCTQYFNHVTIHFNTVSRDGSYTNRDHIKKSKEILVEKIPQNWCLKQFRVKTYNKIVFKTISS